MKVEASNVRQKTQMNAFSVAEETAPAGDLKRLTHPEVVHEGDDALKLLTDFHVDVLVEAGPHGAEGGERRPVVLAGWGRKKIKRTVTAPWYACAKDQMLNAWKYCC